MLAHGDLSTLIKSGVQFGLFGGAVSQPRHPLAPRHLPARHHQPEAARLLRDDRARPRLRRRRPRDHDHLRPGDRRVRGALRDAGGHQGLHRQRRPRRVDGRRLRPAAGARHATTGARDPGADPRRATATTCPASPPATTASKGGLLGVDNGTLRFDRVRVPRRMLLDRYGGVDDDRHLHVADRATRTGASSPCSARWCAAGSASPPAAAIAARRALSIATRYALQRRQFTAPDRPDGVVLLDYLTHQRRLLPAIARAYALGFAQNELTDGPRPHPGRRRAHRARPARAGDAGRRAEGDDHPVRQRHHPGVPRGVRRRRLHVGEPAGRAAGRRRHLRHVRGRQHRAAAAGGQGAAHRLQAGVGRPRPGRHGAGHRPGRRRHGAGAHRGQPADRPAGGDGATASGGAGAGRPGLARLPVRGAGTALAGVAGSPDARRRPAATSTP